MAHGAALRPAANEMKGRPKDRGIWVPWSPISQSVSSDNPGHRINLPDSTAVDALALLVHVHPRPLGKAERYHIHIRREKKEKLQKKSGHQNADRLSPFVFCDWVCNSISTQRQVNKVALRCFVTPSISLPNIRHSSLFFFSFLFLCLILDPL